MWSAKRELWPSVSHFVWHTAISHGSGVLIDNVEVPL
jgi:hypothetical protein